jgi:hypothetical protein
MNYLLGELYPKLNPNWTATQNQIIKKHLR